MNQKYTALLQQIEQLDRDSLIHLSGFLAALLKDFSLIKNNSLEQYSSDFNPIQAPKPHPVLVAFASQTGNAENVALQLSEGLQTNPNLAITLNDVAELNVKKLDQYAYIFIIASTHGEGEPPDTAIIFHEQFGSKRASKLDHVNYAVIALGDSSYEQFCSFGIWIDKRLSELGANALVERLDCDVDYEESIEQWQHNLLNILSKKTDRVTPKNNSIQTLANSTKANNQYTMKNPLTVEVMTNTNLCTDNISKQVHHVELELPSEKINYSPGDSLAISINNPDKLVDEIIQTLALNADDPVIFNKKNASLKDCLSQQAELFRITERQLEALIHNSPNSDLIEKIQQSDYSTFLLNHDWLSVFQSYEKPPFADAQSLVDALNPQGQRLYSIASSPLAHEDEAHLCIRLREFGEHPKLGLISDRVSYLSEGDKINVYLKPNKKFRLPEDDSTAIILIGSGTGIAPFRSFLYQRLSLGITSPAWLFFGEQSFRNSFLYQTDWLKLLEKKVLSRLTPAFSRETQQAAYVQDKLGEHAEEVYQWISQGAIIYVCGSAEGMGAAVHDTLIGIIRQYSSTTQEAASKQLQQMLIEGNYKRDLY